MGQPPKSPVSQPAKRAWVAGFAARLCLIAWAAAILTELLPPSGVESACILVGSQAAGLGIITCLGVGLRFRQGVFLLLLIATAAPGAFFAIIVQQIALQRGWI